MSPELISFIVGAVSGLISGFFMGIYFVILRIRKRFDGFKGLQDTLQEYFKGAQMVDEKNDGLIGDGCTFPDPDHEVKE